VLSVITPAVFISYPKTFPEMEDDPPSPGSFLHEIVNKHIMDINKNDRNLIRIIVNGMLSKNQK
jgi:hypothetical protein